jgi:hypothetical protein
MCNAVCVGIGQFFGPIPIAVTVVAIVGAILKPLIAPPLAGPQPSGASSLA